MGAVNPKYNKIEKIKSLAKGAVFSFLVIIISAAGANRLMRFSLDLPHAPRKDKNEAAAVVS